MGLTEFQYQQLLMRTGRGDHRVPSNAEGREVGPTGIHAKIIQWCDAQWPRWKYRHSRTDKKTREELGVEDFTIFAPNGVTFHVECKTRSGKQTNEQLIWAKELEMLGHKLHVVHSLEEFKELVSVVGSQQSHPAASQPQSASDLPAGRVPPIQGSA